MQDPETAGDEAPKHWAGDGHEDEEIRVHHSSVFLRMMGSMQLSAIGLHGWVAGAGCCCCLPLTLGTLLICLVLLIRGSMALLEVTNIDRVIFTSETLDWGNPFVYIGHFMLAVGGAGDLVAAVCGGFGVSFKQVIPTFVLPVWLFVHTLFGVLFAMIISTLDTMSIGCGWTVVLCSIFLVAPDMYFLLISLQSLLSVTWKGTVAPSMVQVLYAAENIAVRYGSTTKDKNHLVAALLLDHESRQLLEWGGADVEKMDAELQTGSHFLAGEKFGVEELFDKHDPLAFGPDATALLAEAAREQWKAYEPRLTADHLLLALTSGGAVVLEPKGKRLNEVNGRIVSDDGEPSVYPVPQARGMREFIEEAHRQQSTEPGPPPAPVFGCLPVEECVLVYIALQMFLCFLSVCCVIFLGRSLGVLAGLRTVNEMRIVELLSSALGLVLGGCAFYFIFCHRQARQEIRQASYSVGGRWAAELDEAWTKVRTCERAPMWLDQLKAGAFYLSLNLGWNVVQLFVDVPVFLGVLTFGDVCGSYTYGLMKASSSHLQSLAPMHCTRYDFMLLTALVAWGLMKLYMCWCQLALWHEYAYGWTTTELRGSAYLDPFAPMPKDKVRQLAGLPKVAQKRLGDPVNEKTPLML